MENTTQREKQKKAELQLQDTYNDEYWSKEYDISPDEIKKKGNTGIFDLIIEAGIKHKSFSL